MENRWVVEELYEKLRLPGAPSAVIVNRMFGVHRYVKISRGRQEFLIRVVAESRAFQFCKEREREEKLALSWEKIALTFWAENEVVCPEEGQRRAETSLAIDAQYYKTQDATEPEIRHAHGMNITASSPKPPKAISFTTDIAPSTTAEGVMEISSSNDRDQPFLDKLVRLRGKGGINLGYLYQAADKGRALAPQRSEKPETATKPSAI